jgi:hypothetical protein
MIKIRCPEDRLMDVAEVLRVKLKTRQGESSCSRLRLPRQWPKKLLFLTFLRLTIFKREIRSF